MKIDMFFSTKGPKEDLFPAAKVLCYLSLLYRD